MGRGLQCGVWVQSGPSVHTLAGPWLSSRASWRGCPWAVGASAGLSPRVFPPSWPPGLLRVRVPGIQALAGIQALGPAFAQGPGTELSGPGCTWWTPVLPHKPPLSPLHFQPQDLAPWPCLPKGGNACQAHKSSSGITALAQGPPWQVTPRGAEAQPGLWGSS